MKADEIKVIGIAGAGTMGTGIAQVCAQAGFKVVLYDKYPEALKRAEEKMRRRLDAQAWGRIELTENLLDFRNVDFVIEAVAENLAIKQELFRCLDSLCCPWVILATNTSSIPIAEIAAVTQRKERVIGMHFMNPPALVTLVELIRSKSTSKETMELVKSLSLKLGRSPIIESADKPGFIANYILMTSINAAAQAVYDERGTVKDVNQSIIMGVGSSKGMPILELADLIGIDICVNVLEIMQCEPCVLLKKMVSDDFLGRKSGKGFFDYLKK